MEQEIELTILMPCLNEAETLETCIHKAQHFLISEHVSGEILIADNGSTDGSREIAQSNGARVIDVSERGYGAALRGGTEAARGKYIIMGDADDSYDFLNLKPFLEKLREGYELVMGNRFTGKIEKGAMPFLHRYVGNPLLSKIGRILYKSRVGDFHCGLRGYDREAFLHLGLKCSGMEYASEMVVAATVCGLSITEVPIVLYPDGRSRRPHLRTFRDGWRHLKFLLLYCPRWLFLIPGCFLLFAGLLGMVLLNRGPLALGSVVFDIHTLLYMAVFVIVGMQTVFLKILADAYATHCGMTILSSQQTPRKLFTAERCALFGLMLLAAGILISVLSFHHWAVSSYGNLDPQWMMRRTIPAWTLIICGMQLIGNSFFLGLLQS